MAYKFNPEDFGYEHVSSFPELQHLFGNTTYIKVIAIGGSEFDRAVYWYSACYNLGHDDRWRFSSSSFDSAKPEEYENLTTVYMGLISTHAFAKEFLCHLHGTTRNDSVYTHGLDRVTQNINADRLKR